jgi:hypothetical protein
MESGWFGGGLIRQAVTGSIFLLSWASTEESVNRYGRYRVMLVKVEFDIGQPRPLQQVTRAIRPPRMRPTPENLMQAAAFATLGFGRNRGNQHGQHQHY